MTRLFPVKVGLDSSPLEFFLGGMVSGAISFDTPPIMTLPLTAVIESDGKPSVWVVDPASNTVALRAVESYATILPPLSYRTACKTERLWSPPV